jgi:hypothetical protein
VSDFSSFFAFLASVFTSVAARGGSGAWLNAKTATPPENVTATMAEAIRTLRLVVFGNFMVIPFV